jgi:hypothetical protein
LPIPASSGTLRHTGGCLHPVLLRGRADYIDGGTGELIHRYTTVHEPGGARKGALTWEPPIGIEPMTYALRVRRSDRLS